DEDNPVALTQPDPSGIARLTLDRQDSTDARLTRGHQFLIIENLAEPKSKLPVLISNGEALDLSYEGCPIPNPRQVEVRLTGARGPWSCAVGLEEVVEPI